MSRNGADGSAGHGFRANDMTPISSVFSSMGPVMADHAQQW